MSKCEIGSEFDWNSNMPFQEEEDSFFSGYNFQGYRSGRDALKAIAKEYRTQTKRILMPALCCESMVLPFLMNGFKPVFYKISDNYTIDIADVDEKIEENCLFLYLSYFGIKSIDEEVLQKWKEEYQITAIEDKTQNALSLSKESFAVADVIIISIRKWLALPDGGLLWSKKPFNIKKQGDNSFFNLRLSAMRKKSTYLLNPDRRLKEEYRGEFQKAAEILDESCEPFEMSNESKNLLRKISFKKVLLRRQENVEALKTYLDKLEKQGKLSYITLRPEESTLYFPILLKNRDIVQKKLAEVNIYCPVIWPVPSYAKGVCEKAEYIATHMLALPCDQRYDVEDMKFVAKTVISLMEELE